MLQISRQQVLERWDALPENLKEALFSEINANIVWQVGTLNHLSEEKISIMAMMVGDVIFGFLHPDDLAREIQETLNLNPQIANSISHEINRKIFAPLRIDLEKVYSPVNAIPEIKPPTKPETEIKIEKEIEFKPVAPKPEVVAKPVEITELPKTEIRPPKIEPVIAPKPISAEKPFIIHQETEARAFTEKKKTTMPTMGWFKKERSKTPESPIKVELETFGQKTEEKKKPVIAKTETPKQRIVHYREVEIPATFGKTPASAEASAGRQGKPEGQTPKEIPPQKIETPIIKPELSKPITPTAPATKPEPPVKSTGPTVINLDSFSVTRENKNPNEVKLDGNIINLKNKSQ